MTDAPWPDSDDAFVAAASERVLGRAPEAHERATLLGELAGADRAGLLLRLLRSAEHRELLETKRFVPAGHFYSPIPSREEVDAHRSFDWNVPSLPGIDLRVEAQEALVSRIADGFAELPFRPEPTPGLRYHYENPNYSYSDAIFLASMIREARPKRFIEVGSGDSSCVLLDTNDRFFDGTIDFTFIEPYPAYLQELLGPDEAQRIRLIPSRLQDVEMAEFERLEAGDILFIDSTHVSKLGSDVNHVIFEILPRLAPGVYVHVHDVFWPFEYPHEWLAAGRAWNEQYLLRAFLEHNPEYEIVLFGHWAVTQHTQWFTDRLPLCLKNAGGSIWLRRRDPT